MSELTGFRQQVFHDRYALKDENGARLEERPDEMWRRVAKAISQAEKTPAKQQEWEKKFHDALADFQFVPAGRILTGAGAGVDLTFYNCFVIPSPADSREGIFESVHTMVEIMSRGGGVGVNLSSLRPRGAYVKGVNGTASGAVSFGGLYSYATGLIIQGGSRRGALMLMLDDDHPDIEEFITVKRTMGQITNANLSVAISDRFMEAVENDADWDLKWEGKVYKTIKAKELWHLICESAHGSGEPGMLFMERVNKESNSWYFEDLISVNPCGEQPLPAWGVCNLGAVNIAAFVNEDGSFDRKRLTEVVHTSMRFLDNVIEATPYFYPENEEAQMKVRRTGLGTLGLADALIKSKIRYGSEEAIQWCNDIYALIRDEAYRASVEIAKEKGVFPEFDAEKFGQGTFIKNLPKDLQEDIRQYGIRNGLLLTQAPTGTTSILSGVSSGIEPVYDFAMKRKDRLGEHTIYHPLYEEWKQANPNLDDADAPEYFVSAKELSPMEHVKMQAVIQKYTDASISKTVNAPNEHTIEDVEELYMQAYKLGCKGVTYYRDGSRDISVLSSLSDEDKKDKKKDIVEETAAPVANNGATVPRERPEYVAGITYKIKTGYGTMYVTINHDDEGKPFEIFATIGKAGGVFAAKSEAICRLVSLALRSNVQIDSIIEQLKGIRGPMPSWSKFGQVLSIPDAIGTILSMHIENSKKFADNGNGFILGEDLLRATQSTATEEVTVKETVASSGETISSVTMKSTRSVADMGLTPECPECGNILAMAEGCMTCHGCGYSKCA